MHISRPSAVWCGIAGIAPAAFLMPFTLLIGAVKWGPMPVGVLGAAGFLGLCLACMNGHRQRGLLWSSVAAVLLCFGLSLALPWAVGMVFATVEHQFDWRNIWMVLVFVGPCVVAIHYLLWFGFAIIRRYEPSP
ncbi:MAG: hypothetical protein U1D69_04045 [Polynucleobacter sp.]|nr:hypothetical protein [Polynucleobacter sp.]